MIGLATIKRVHKNNDLIFIVNLHRYYYVYHIIIVDYVKLTNRKYRIVLRITYKKRLRARGALGVFLIKNVFLLDW